MGKHRQLALSLAAGALALAPALLAQTAQPLLPERLEQAQRQEWESAAAQQLGTLTGELTAAVLREYGAVEAEQAVYRHGPTSFRITLCVLHDRSGAYGAYTFLRRDARARDLGEAGVQDQDGATFYQRNYLVMAGKGAPPSVLAALANALADRSPDHASLPLLPEYLPEQGLVPRSDMYLLGPVALERAAPLAQGDWVGFAYGAEAEAARYRVGSRQATLLLVSYPTPHIARARLADFQRLFNLNQQGGRGPVVFARRKSTLVVLVHGLDSAAEADPLMDAVRYQPQLSWSEPPPIDDKEIISGLLGIFMGTGLIMFLTLGLGLAFGVARLLLASTLPGRVFDKPVENERIFLNLQNPK